MNLGEEFPILTTKQLFIRQAVLEMLWIYQAKSNDVRRLNPDVKNFFDYDNSKDLNDVKVLNYKHHGKIKFPIAQ